MIATIAAAIAAVIVAVLAYAFGVRWLAYRGSLLTEASRMDRIEAELAQHKETHAKALANLVAEMRDSINEVKTRSSLALERANGRTQRRFGS